jgi:hypothetical protein
MHTPALAQRKRHGIVLIRMSRRKAEERNLRILFKRAAGKSYALTLPREIVRAFGWDIHRELQLKIDDKRQRITVEASPRPHPRTSPQPAAAPQAQLQAL